MRTHGLGFCPPANSIFEVSIERDVDGLLLQLSTLEEEAQSDDCLPGLFPEDRCLVVRDQLSRYLRSDEVARLADTFASVVVRNAPASECRGCFIDPCVITTMQWDSLQTTDYICSESNRIDDAQHDAIIEMLEMLRQ